MLHVYVLCGYLSLSPSLFLSPSLSLSLSLPAGVSCKGQVEVPAEGWHHEDEGMRVRVPQGQWRGGVVAMETDQYRTTVQKLLL